MKSCISFSISFITGVIKDKRQIKARIGIVKLCIIKAYIIPVQNVMHRLHINGFITMSLLVFSHFLRKDWTDCVKPDRSIMKTNIVVINKRLISIIIHYVYYFISYSFKFIKYCCITYSQNFSYFSYALYICL